MYFDWWQAVAGLGLFLYAMRMLEKSVESLGGHTLKRWVQDYTDTPLKGLLIGIAATAILQSSSLIGLIVLAFVGAGILPIRHALAIIFGANLGTTFTGWIVATLGFKLKLDAFALPLIALGSVGIVFIDVERFRRWHFSLALALSMGLLFLGLGYMKSAFTGLAEVADVSVIADYPLWAYVLAAALFTALIQSSSATMMIVLSAMSSGMLDLSMAAALVIGADLGTTSTVLLGAIKGKEAKRQVAYAHLIFNLVTDILAFILLVPLVGVIADNFHISDPLYATVAFHSTFNIIGVVLFIPLIKPFASWLERLVKDDKPVIGGYIEKVSAKVSEAAITAIDSEIKELLINALILNAKAQQVNLKGVPAQYAAAMEIRFEQLYAELKQRQSKVMQFIHHVYHNDLQLPEIERLAEQTHGLRHILYAAKAIKDSRENLLSAKQATTNMRPLFEDLNRDSAEFYQFILLMLDEERSSFDLNDSFEKIADCLGAIAASYQQISEQLYTSHPDEGAMPEESINLLHINRAIYKERESLLESLRIYFDINESIMDLAHHILAKHEGR